MSLRKDTRNMTCCIYISPHWRESQHIHTGICTNKYFGGVDKYFTPFLAPGPEQGMSVKEMRDVLPENNAGVPVVPQILTNRAGDFLLASKKLAEMGYREINLNLDVRQGRSQRRKKVPVFYFTRMIWIVFLMKCSRTRR
ncbi:MAG: hypothetical protein ACLUAR_04430 [Pilosibacter sp.]